MVNFSVLVAAVSMLLGLTSAGDGASKELYKCRQVCYTRFVQDWHHCMDYEECKNMCITPPNINNYIPEAFSFLCWNSCDESLGPFQIEIKYAVRRGSLVLAEVSWDQAVTNASRQCLVTWEVSGGGLMGNLLTDSSTVELSLWSDTIYHVLVTCKNKETGKMRRSYKLIVDTRTFTGKAETISPIGMETDSKKSMHEIFPTEPLSIQTEDRLKILKDSSKDTVDSTNVKTSTSSSSSSKSDQSSTDDEAEVRIPTVIRSKLSSNRQDSSELFSRSILFAMIGSLALFLGIVIVYILTRTRDDIPVDKENLIKNEIVPGTRTLHV